MGFRDTMTGVQDTGKGLSQIMKGDLFNGFLTLGMGVGDLGSGLYNFVIPAMKGFTKTSLLAAKQTVLQTVATARQRTVMLLSATATKGMTVAQKALNLAMRLNPIGLIITALILLGTGLVLAYKKSQTFRTIVNGALNGVKAGFKALVTAAVAVYNWFKTNIPKIGGFFVGVGKAIAAPFQSAFNGIRNAWNNTVGGKGFSVPGWIPGLGGKDFRIPYFHNGGIVGGGMGAETLAVLKAGEKVTAGSNRADSGTIVLQGDGTAAMDALLRVLKEAVRIKGGWKVVTSNG
jgi:hypothetical protein